MNRQLVSGIPLSRRELLQASATGFGWLAFSALAAEAAEADVAAARVRLAKPARAKNVIFCFMAGGVSHVDSFDPKPKLSQLDGQAVGKVDNPTTPGVRRWLKSPWKFKQHGQSGLPVSELFPHLAGCVDDLAVIRSVQSSRPSHQSAVLYLHTGHNDAGRPSCGSWVNYGLGSLNKDLPGYVVLNFGGVPPGGMDNFSSGFLPANYQATLFNVEGAPIDNIVPAYNRRVQRSQLDWIAGQNQRFSRRLGTEDAVESAIRNYELAFRMQAQAPAVLDLAQETEETKKLYGRDSPVASKRQYALQCLRARRLIEAGVRFVEISSPPSANGVWDQHGKIKEGHEKNAFDVDQPIAGLLKDLKRRGLLDETLVLWAGEFGRTPHTAGSGVKAGRDHHPEGFTVWLAGGGVKGGTAYGATDELGMRASENLVSMHDLHATLLHALGLDHERLTYRFGGRDFRLTDTLGGAKAIMAILDSADPKAKKF
jgi:hypothetical protein